MKPALQRLTVFVASIAAAVGALAQEPAFPAGNWQSATSETYTNPLHPVLTGAEFSLKIDVSDDGSFRGEWGECFCSGLRGRLRNQYFPVPLLREKRARFRQIRPGSSGCHRPGAAGPQRFQLGCARCRRTGDRSAEELARGRDSLSGAPDARWQGQTGDH